MKDSQKFEKFDKYRKQLKPSSEQMQRVWAKVDSRLEEAVDNKTANTENSDNPNNNFYQHTMKYINRFFNSKYNQAGLVFLAALIFMAPGVIMSNGSTESLTTPVAPENTITDVIGGPDYSINTYFDDEVPEEWQDLQMQDTSNRQQMETSIQRPPRVERGPELGGLDPETTDIDATFEFSTNDVQKLKRETESLIASLNGDIYQQSYIEEQGSARFRIGVPIDNFDQFVNELKALDMQLRLENVTKTDLQERLGYIDQQIDKLEAGELNEEQQQELESLKDRKTEVLQEASYAEVSVLIENDANAVETGGLSQLISDLGLTTFASTLSTSLIFWARILAWLTVPAIFVAVWWSWRKRNVQTDTGE